MDSLSEKKNNSDILNFPPSSQKYGSVIGSDVKK